MSELKIQDWKLPEYDFVFRMSGTNPVDAAQSVELKDVLSSQNAPLFMPKVISNIVKEAAEPYMIATSLLQRINYSYGQTISFPAVGALTAADMSEGQEYRESSLAVGGATVTATVGKVGLAVKVTEEMIRYSQYDIIGLHLRAAGKALARHKEGKIFNYIREMGTCVFDNVTPTASLKGVTTGRSLQGSGNGSFTMDDLFDMYAQVLHQGFVPNTLLMHPLTWVMFVKDPILRSFALASGGGVFFAGWQGSPAGQAPWSNGAQGKLGMGMGQNIIPGSSASGDTATSLLSYPQTISSAPRLPTYFNVPFTILVSPLVPFNTSRLLTDIYMFDSTELGALIVDEEVTTEEWLDPARDIRKIKLRERYGIGIFNEGQAIAVAKNVHIVPNMVVLPAQATIDASGSLATIGATDVVL
jgi:hypothetical protein